MCQLVRDMIVHVRIGIINDLAALEPFSSGEDRLVGLG